MTKREILELVNTVYGILQPEPVTIGDSTFQRFTSPSDYALKRNEQAIELLQPALLAYEEMKGRDALISLQSKLEDLNRGPQ